MNDLPPDCANVTLEANSRPEAPGNGARDKRRNRIFRMLACASELSIGAWHEMTERRGEYPGAAIVESAQNIPICAIGSGCDCEM